MRPDVSVVIPAFNAAGTLPATLRSLARQDAACWEAVVVDDGSHDGTPELVERAMAADGRIRLLRNPRKGPSAARNHGAAEARGGLIACCDADALWQPQKLRRMADVFADTTVDAAYGRIGFFSHAPEDARVFSTVPRGDLDIRTLTGENPVCTMSNLVVRSDRFHASGGFDETLVHNEDLEWLIRLVGSGERVVGVDETLVWYRNSSFGLSADFAAMRRGRAAALDAARRFGVTPDARAEAIHLRYLARRALRLDAGRGLALRLASEGLARSPRGFLSDPRRGGLTMLGALVAPVLTRSMRRALFAR